MNPEQTLDTTLPSQAAGNLPDNQLVLSEVEGLNFRLWSWDRSC